MGVHAILPLPVDPLYHFRISISDTSDEVIDVRITVVSVTDPDLFSANIHAVHLQNQREASVSEFPEYLHENPHGSGVVFCHFQKDLAQ